MSELARPLVLVAMVLAGCAAPLHPESGEATPTCDPYPDGRLPPCAKVSEEATVLDELPRGIWTCVSGWREQEGYRELRSNEQGDLAIVVGDIPGNASTHRGLVTYERNGTLHLIEWDRPAAARHAVLLPVKAAEVRDLEETTYTLVPNDPEIAVTPLWSPYEGAPWLHLVVADKNTTVIVSAMHHLPPPFGYRPGDVTVELGGRTVVIEERAYRPWGTTTSGPRTDCPRGAAFVPPGPLAGVGGNDGAPFGRTVGLP